LAANASSGGQKLVMFGYLPAASFNNLGASRARATVIGQFAQVTCLAEYLHQSFGDPPPVLELLIV
jgi:hypothetical protein